MEFSIDAESVRRDAAQMIFDRTAPTKNLQGDTVEIPFAQWRPETQAYFLKLADMWLSKATQ